MDSAGVVGPRRRLVGRLQQKRAGAQAEAASAVPGSRRGVNDKEGTSLCGEREGEGERQRSQDFSACRTEPPQSSQLENQIKQPRG